MSLAFRITRQSQRPKRYPIVGPGLVRIDAGPIPTEPWRFEIVRGTTRIFSASGVRSLPLIFNCSRDPIIDRHRWDLFQAVDGGKLILEAWPAR